jgi:hypothetical protein
LKAVAVARDEDADVRYGQAVPDGDEVHGSHPGSTKGINGQVLAKDVSWTFTTPPPKVEQTIPVNQITRRDALMFISFDQQINPEAVLKTMSVTSGGRKIATRLATQEEIDRDSNISNQAKQAQRAGGWCFAP